MRTSRQAPKLTTDPRSTVFLKSGRTKSVLIDEAMQIQKNSFISFKNICQKTESQRCLPCGMKILREFYFADWRFFCGLREQILAV